MESGIQKLLRKLVMKKYPMYLDIQVRPYIEGLLRTNNPFNRERYEVTFVIHEERYKDFEEDWYFEIMEYVRDIARYMDVEVKGFYNQIVDDEQWEKMKLNKKD